MQPINHKAPRQCRGALDERHLSRGVGKRDEPARPHTSIGQLLTRDQGANVGGVIRAPDQMKLPAAV